jgi:hypothetical protein
MKATQNMTMRRESWVTRSVMTTRSFVTTMPNHGSSAGLLMRPLRLASTSSGLEHYGNGDGSSKVIIKVKDPGSDVAYYIGFNHQAKHNSDTREATNQVTIQEYVGNGRAESNRIGKIAAGNQWRRVLGSDTVTVIVGAITTNADTGVANVTIKYGAVASEPTFAVRSLRSVYFIDSMNKSDINIISLAAHTSESDHRPANDAEANHISYTTYTSAHQLLQLLVLSRV